MDLLAHEKGQGDGDRSQEVGKPQADTEQTVASARLALTGKKRQGNPQETAQKGEDRRAKPKTSDPLAGIARVVTHEPPNQPPEGKPARDGADSRDRGDPGSQPFPGGGV